MTAAKAAETTKTASSAKYIAEHREDVVHRETTAKAAETTHAARSVEAELVVLLTFLRIVKNIVGLGSLLELLLRLFVAGVAVGVILDGDAAVSLLDIVFAGILVDAEHLVIISFCHSFFVDICRNKIATY